VTEGTEGKGPFESHTSGNFLMKELRAPWLHWHSPDAGILPSVFAPNNPLRRHPWFRGLEPLGAVTCEAEVARPSIRRWTRVRFAALLSGGGVITRPSRVMSQIVGTPTVNLITSHTEGRAGAVSEDVDLPQTFFIDSEGLTEILGLQAPPPFEVKSKVYAESLRTFGFRVTDGEKFDRPGDTHFAFAVPERAFEDVAVMAEAIRVGLLTERFAACLLMTDFANPIFSSRRARLLRHTPKTATVTAGQSTFSEEMATAIVAAARQAGKGSPEAEFATGWAKGEGWKNEFNGRLANYYAAVTTRLKSQNGFNDYCRLAESRRENLRSMPIFESPLLLATTNILPSELAMRPDGTIAEVV